MREQSDLQAISSAVAAPSSQASPVTLKPSPHIGEQFEGVFGSPPWQFHPVTFPVHKELHLSLFDVSPSSQVSQGERTFESPQITVQIDNYPKTFVQVHPA